MKKNLNYSGTLSDQVSSRELENRKIARKAAGECPVLLKNEGVLPLEKGEKIALFGAGAVHTIKGGTGSGDVNERECISIQQGLKEAGIPLVSENWLTDYSDKYNQARLAWREEILSEVSRIEEFFDTYAAHAFRMPAGREITSADVQGAAKSVYVVSRVAGEAADRKAERGDYYLSQKELADLERLSEYGQEIIVLINSGGLIDLEEILSFEGVKGILSVSQLGMEGGHAVADILTGQVNPSGKLTDTWAADYQDYSICRGETVETPEVVKEYYHDDIYVGYRHFDRTGIKPRYAFGYGLSYTEFALQTLGLEIDHPQGFCPEITVYAAVQNIGEKAGKEVVQVYAVCPSTDRLPKEEKRLVAFGKTGLLAPGQEEKMEFHLPLSALASYDETCMDWILEDNVYGIFIGNSSDQLEKLGAVLVSIEENGPAPASDEGTGIELPEEMPCVSISLQSQGQVFAPWSQEAACLRTDEEKKMLQEKEEKAEQIVGALTEKDHTALVIGEIVKSQDNAFGSSGVTTPGSAAETSAILLDSYGIPGAVLADGPAGLRLTREFNVDEETGQMLSQGILDALENGFFRDPDQGKEGRKQYQFCTSFPVGTALAQSWNTDLLEEVGKAVGREMEEFDITFWLAPGMNIHRNPLCGRNFEYYSEDPVVSGMIAAAITRGVQSYRGCWTTIKHFACNNQEYRRMSSDSILSERALREIYLKGFEIAVKLAQPGAIMTSYNLVNGVHAANSEKLCTDIARKEWGFEGLIMTDWTTTFDFGGSISWKCIDAGNDLIMPGFEGDFESIEKALADGSLSPEKLKACAKRVVMGMI